MASGAPESSASLGSARACAAPAGWVRLWTAGRAAIRASLPPAPTRPLPVAAELAAALGCGGSSPFKAVTKRINMQTKYKLAEICRYTPFYPSKLHAEVRKAANNPAALPSASPRDGRSAGPDATCLPIRHRSTWNTQRFPEPRRASSATSASPAPTNPDVTGVSSERPL